MRELLPHTADLRAEISSPDLDGLYAEAALLVRELLVGDSAVEERSERRLTLAGDEEPERFFRFLRELVYLADSEGFVPARAHRAVDTAILVGETFDPSRHVPERQLKAVTRHGFELAREGAVWRCRVLFDL